MKENNIIQGSIIKALIKLALPITLTGFMEMSYTFTDMFWIGMKGTDYVTAVGGSGNFIWLAVCLIIIPYIGGKVKIAYYIGANNINLAKEYIASAFQLGLSVIVVFSLIFYFTPNTLVSIFNFNSPLTIKLCIEYLQVQAFAIIPYSMSLIFTGIYTAIGNTMIGLICNGIGLIINILLDPLFIYVLDMGVRGASLATLISNVIVFLSFVYCTRYYKSLFTGINLIKINITKIKEIIKIGFAPALKNGVFAMVTLSIGRIIASYGSYAVGVQKVGAQIEAISWRTADGLSSAINTFTAQNYGAGKLDRALKAYKIAFCMCLIIGGLASLILFVFPKELISIFFTDKNAIRVGSGYLFVMGVSQVFMCIDIVSNGALAGIGYTLVPNIICMFIIMGRVPLSLLLSSRLEISGIWWSMTTSSILTATTAFTIYMYIWRKKNKENVYLQS